jgi:hypothetical protein
MKRPSSGTFLLCYGFCGNHGLVLCNDADYTWFCGNVFAKCADYAYFVHFAQSKVCVTISRKDFSILLLALARRWRLASGSSNAFSLRWHHYPQTVFRDLHIHRCLSPHFTIQRHVAWVSVRPNSHAFCLYVMDAGNSDQVSGMVFR